MASHSSQSQPTFTVEQIELIRRLRNSGLTKKQVVQAFESFERVDAELGNLYTTAPLFSQLMSFTTAGSQNTATRTLPAQPSQPAINSETPKPPSPVSTTAHVNRRFQGIRRSRELSVENGGSQERVSGRDVIQVSMQDAFPQAKAVKHYRSDDEMSQRVDEFLLQGTDKMYEEIRDFFVANPNFSPNDMASAAGVGVTCVSKFLVGNLSALSPQVLRPLCQWFLTTRMQHNQSQQAQHCTSSTSKMLRDIVQERLNGGFSPSDTVSSTFSDKPDGRDIKPADILSGNLPIPTYPEGLDVQFTPRRERFTFRKKHLEILEAYFKTNQYPTYEERTDIAQRCNDIMEAVVGRGLGEKERMTAQNVAYWFSNRRKDIKRIAREGGIDMSEVILPSRVRQSPPSMLSDNSQAAAAAAAAWAVDKSEINFSSLEAPNFGPVAFPTATRASDMSTVETNSMSSDSQSGSETGTLMIPIKREPADSEPFSVSSSTQHGRGSAVNRIAAEISSQLRSAMSSLTSSASMSEAVNTSSTLVDVKPPVDMRLDS